MKEHTIEVTLRFVYRYFPDEREWTDIQWKRQIAALLEDEHRGLARYMGCKVVALAKDGVLYL